jgi:hypothetical protein
LFSDIDWIKGFEMEVDSWRYNVPDNATIQSDNLLLPEILIEKSGQSPAEILLPIFDMVWNSAGWFRSLNYDEMGTWVGRRR